MYDERMRSFENQKTATESPKDEESVPKGDRVCECVHERTRMLNPEAKKADKAVELWRSTPKVRVGRHMRKWVSVYVCVLAREREKEIAKACDGDFCSKIAKKGASARLQQK